MAERQAAALSDGIFFSPFDYGVCVRRAFRTVRPTLLIIIETEIWPNLFATARQSGTALAILNGRISDRTWPRYRRWRAFFWSILGLPQLVQVQSRADAERYTTLGVAPAALVVDANLKYDAAMPDGTLDLRELGADHVWIAASTVGPNERGSLEAHNVDEDDLVLTVFRQLADEFPRLLLILAPRQPGRFEAVAVKLQTSGLSYSRRSSPAAKLSLPGVLLLDSMGELSQIYSQGNVVFVGGSLAPRGGHNVIEPAAAGVPVIVGPHMQNFQVIVQDFLESKALLQISSADQLVPTVRDLLLSRERALALGERGRAVVLAKRGVSRRSIERLIPLYYASSFHRSYALPVQMLLHGLSKIWMAGGALKRKCTTVALPVPVVSVGGLSMGGTGKTPFTLALVRLLQSRGHSPAILTRGYRRQVHYNVFARPGEVLPIQETGDETQIFLRRAIAPVGIGSDRGSVAAELLQRFPQTDILVLDDGFQHARLRRDLDIVLIDGLDPFGNGQVFPAGRLREPLEALGRAQIAVVTRCVQDEQFGAIADRLRALNPNLAVFRTNTIAGLWRNTDTDEPAELPDGARVAAFCGLGNPASFWQTLAALPLQIVLRRAFRDHHRYRMVVLREFWREARQRGADYLVTTEKDRANFPASLSGIPVRYLPIDMWIQEEKQLFDLLPLLQKAVELDAPPYQIRSQTKH